MPWAGSWKSEAARRLFRYLPLRVQLATRYRQVNGAAPDLRRPRLLSERILQRILIDRDPLLKTFCDKVAAKDWIAARIGPGHTPRTLAVTADVEALQALPLPERWMLKASHGSGWYQLVSPTQPLEAAVVAQARAWLNSDFADGFQEWGYRQLPRRLLAEEWLSLGGQPCLEMSAFCFHGRVRGIRLFEAEPALEVPQGHLQRVRRTQECFLDESLQVLSLVRPHHDHWPALAAAIDRQRLNDFLELAEALASASPFLRVDGYLCDRGALVGELTPYPGAGIMYRLPRQWDAWFGAFWEEGPRRREGRGD